MTPENWHRIKEIFGEALDRDPAEREAFIRRASDGDAALLEQLLLLLAETERESNLLSRPALADAAAVTRGDSPRFAPSAVLARRYRIVRFIARGGMGEVYEAEDIELGGRVALKAIRNGAAGEPDLRTLFKREIQLARQVTHPNVCRIFDLAQHDDPESGKPALLLSMELIEGQSLSEHVRSNGPLTAPSALPLIEEIAAGLQAIHDAGIVHGDLKPANVMLVLPAGETTPHARVMDFGMAFPVGQSRTRAAAAGGEAVPGSAPAVTPNAPPERLIGGTPDYFAPEQARGEPASIASDVYAFGLVVAEMLGIPHSARTIAKVGSAPPSWSQPLRRALDPDPARRYSRPSDLAAALRAAAERPARTRRRLLAAAAATVLVVVAARRVDTLFRGVGNGLVMTESPSETVDSPSPDGKFLAGTSWDTGDLILHEVGSGKIRRLTRKRTPIDSVFGGAFGALFSPDGRRIVYVWANSRQSTEIRIIGADGKGDRTLYRAPENVWPTLLDYSPDGAQILFTFATTNSQAPSVGLLSTADGSARFLDGALANDSLRFDSDARSFLYRAKSDRTGAFEIRRLRPGGTETSLIASPGSNTLIGWASDRRRLIFSSDRRGQPGIWTVAVSANSVEDEPRELAPNTKGWEPLGITRNGALFYRQDSSTLDVYTAALDIPAGRTISAPRRATERFIGAYSNPSWSGDGLQLVFNSTREAQAPTLMFFDPATRETRELRVPLQWAGRPQWVEQGTAVMVMGKAVGSPPGLFRVDAHTGEPKLFGSGKDLGTTFEGVWSGDGRYHYNRFGDFRRGLFRLDLQTREQRVLFIPPPGTAMGLENLALSPDGRTLAFHLRNETAGTSSLMLVPTEGGVPRALFTVAAPQRFLYGSFTWTPDSLSLLASSSRPEGNPRADKQVSELWRVPVDGSSPSKIDFPAMSIQCLRLNPDGKTIAFHSRRGKSEIWVFQPLL